MWGTGNLMKRRGLRSLVNGILTILYMKKIVLCGWLLCGGLFCLPSVSVEAATTTAATTTVATTTPSTQSVEARVREYFADVPIMIEIARCESKFRQFTDAGNVLRGGTGRNMIGVFQFYDQIHTAAALALGFDLTTVDGNLGYARHVYSLSGTTPWNSAHSCWGVRGEATSSSVQDANTELRIKLLTQLVGLLQQLLALQLAVK